MTVHAEWIRYGENNTYSAYVARPERVSGPLPAIVVIQEVWGVDDHIQDVTKRFAQAGYVAFAPDLYASDGVRRLGLAAERINQTKSFMERVPPQAWHNPDARAEELAKLPEPLRTEIGQTFTTLFSGLDPERYIGQLLVTTDFLRNEYAPSKGRGAASVGFCMGGALSGLLACRDANLQGAVIFYGNAPRVDDVKRLACPVLGFYGSKDTRITEAVPAFAETVKDAGGQFEYHIYEGAHHAFFNDTRSSYHVGAARDAYARALTFFRDRLV